MKRVTHREWWEQVPQECSVCNSALRPFIEADIAAGDALAAICERYGIPTKILVYHKLNHLDNKNETI